MTEQAWPLCPDEPDGTVYGYMCKTDFECELGYALGGNTIYPDVEDLKKHSPCVVECGIVKVAVRCVEVVQPSCLGDEGTFLELSDEATQRLMDDLDKTT